MHVLCWFFMFAVYFLPSDAHSWVHCVDYDPAAPLTVGSIRDNYCNAYPRGLRPGIPFAEDRGFDFRPGTGRACRNTYSGNIVRYVRGQQYRLIWPAKNHASGSCTNPNIKDQSLRLYAYPVRNLSDPDPSLSTWSRYMVFDFYANGGKGFQNCPDFCPVADRVPCFGDIQLNLSTGYYKLIWVWIFNPNEVFTHCFDVFISSSTTKAPTTKAPTTKAPTTRAPTNSGNCVDVWGQCGGWNWSGSTVCCSNRTCIAQNAYFFQCVPY